MKKIFSLFIVAISLIALASCISTASVTSVEFNKVPSEQYSLNADINASDFSVKIFQNTGTTLEMNLTNSSLTVTGLNGSKLDTSSVGTKVVTVSYQGFSVTVSYLVVNNDITTENWINFASDLDCNQSLVSISSAADLAALAKYANIASNSTAGKTYTLTTDIDLVGKEWTPIFNFKGVFDGKNHKINNLTISKEVGISHDSSNVECGKGLFGSVTAQSIIKDLTLDTVKIICISDGIGDPYKNYAALVGFASAELFVENVVIQNSNIIGHGRIGAIVGQGYKLNITNCDSINNTFSAVNGYSSVSSDGNGDKVGGLIGQSNAVTKIINSTVENCTITGTRDLGGVTGYVAGDNIITNVSVVKTKVLASVPGGMAYKKGARNLGGFFGTISGTSGLHTKITLTGISFPTDEVNTNVVSSNSTYGEISSVGQLVGGLRCSYQFGVEFVIGENSYTFNVTEGNQNNANNIAIYAEGCQLMANYMDAIIKGENPVLPTLNGFNFSKN